MCACDWNYECVKCAMGVWPYPRLLIDDDPAELAQERRDRIISAPDFEQPVGAA